MKKLISVLLVAILLVTCVSTSSFAAKTSEIVSPYYNNVNNADLNYIISDEGKATVKLTCKGKSGVTTKITAANIDALTIFLVLFIYLHLLFYYYITQ